MTCAPARPALRLPEQHLLRPWRQRGSAGLTRAPPPMPPGLLPGALLAGLRGWHQHWATPLPCAPQEEEDASYSAYQLRMMAYALESAPPPPLAPAVRLVMPAAGAAPASSRSLAQHRLPRRALCVHGCGALVWEEEKDKCCKKGDMRLSEEHNPPISPQYCRYSAAAGRVAQLAALNRQLATPLSYICVQVQRQICAH